MRYIPVTIEPSGVARATRIAFEQAQGGTLYRRPDGSHVIVRADDAVWPPYSSPQPVTDQTGWTEVTA